MRIILIALSFFIATVAYCGLDMETVKKLYADLGIELKTDQKTVEEYDKDLKKYQAEAKKGNAEANQVLLQYHLQKRTTANKRKSQLSNS